MMRKLALVLAAALGAASQLHAQRAGTIEVGVFPTIAYPDRTLHLNNARAGPGARIGYFFTDRLAIEAEGSWVPTNGRNDLDVKYMPLHARLVLNFPASEHVGLLLGGGYSHSRFRDVGARDSLHPEGLSDHGVSGNAGIRLGMGDITSVRVDVFVDYIPSPDNHAKENWHWGFQPGLSFLLGGRSAGPRDRDRDGVPDDVDQCRDTPEGDRVDAKGCTVKDADGDGVTDDVDACADTPAGEQVDAKGCPLPKDGDGDGVNDDADRCPSTPSGVEVDAEGCQVLFEPTKKTLILEGVNFETGKSTLTPESETILNGVAESLVANDSIRVEVVGHTDNTGSMAVNRRLSLARAQAVRDYLASKGVAEDRLRARGMGPDQPVTSNRTPGAEPARGAEKAQVDTERERESGKRR
jgi:OOP family OmpA-OmpF porin